jgi:hypothetical protein
MTEAPRKRRWLWLSGLIAFVILFAGCLWGRSQLVLVNERREFLRAFHNGDGHDLVVALSPDRLPPHEGPAAAPWPVHALGEEAVGFIWIDGRAPASAKSTEIARLKELFPEAEVKEAPEQALRVHDEENLRLKRLKEDSGR